MKGVELREGCEFSKHFDNRPLSYKVVEVGNILAYVILGGGRESGARITPLYRADVHKKIGKVWHITSSFEYGEALNEPNYHIDYEGCSLASIARQAVSALEHRAHMSELVKTANKMLKKRKRKR
jgi:hypothetical protein